MPPTSSPAATRSVTRGTEPGVTLSSIVSGGAREPASLDGGSINGNVCGRSAICSRAHSDASNPLTATDSLETEGKGASGYIVAKAILLSGETASGGVEADADSATGTQSWAPLKYPRSAVYFVPARSTW